MIRKMAVLMIVGAVWLAPALGQADHDPRHDTRHNPNCAWDAKRSADWNGDGEPDHMVVGLGHDTSFPRQIVTVIEPYTGIDQIPPFFGTTDGPDQVSVVVQGDHRMLGANPPTDETGDSDTPEQQHNGAIYAHVDYDDVESGRTPRAEFGAGIYEANHLVMACGSTDGDPEAALCPNGTEVYRMTDEECPQD
jgi:hypothetical protein